MQKTSIRKKWYASFRCFQGRCTRAKHEFPDTLSTYDLWCEMFMGDGSSIDNGALIPEDYTEEEMIEMVEDKMADDGYPYWDDGLIDSHLNEQSDWLRMVCQCASPRAKKDENVPFDSLTKVNTSGLQPYCLHVANQISRLYGLTLVWM
jgi:hypothetical protein